MGQIVAIVSQKGGVGKTSTAVNLGACLSAMKKRTLLVGIDPQCGLAKCFGLDDSDARIGLLELVRDNVPASEVIYPSHPRLPRLDIIPANVKTMAEEAQYVDSMDRELNSGKQKHQNLTTEPRSLNRCLKL